MAKMLPLQVTLERCHELLEICEPSDFEKESGLKWKVDRRRARAGDWAGYLHNVVKNNGEIRKDWMVKIDSKLYYAARIIYFMHHGVDPYPLQIDHINRDSRDNRVENLRLGDDELQEENKDISKRNKSGIKNVHKHKCGKWVVNIKGNYLGLFTTRREAAAAKNLGVIKYFSEETWEVNLVDLETITD